MGSSQAKDDKTSGRSTSVPESSIQRPSSGDASLDDAHWSTARERGRQKTTSLLEYALNGEDCDAQSTPSTPWSTRPNTPARDAPKLAASVVPLDSISTKDDLKNNENRKRKSAVLVQQDDANPTINTRPSKRKRIDRSEEDRIYDVADISLPGDEDGEVEVYDTCDVVRAKIRAYLAIPRSTQAAFLRQIAKAFPREKDKKIQSKLLNDFLNKKGATAGNTSSVYYGAYVFFEKLRIRDGLEKSETRIEMEKLYNGADGEPRGLDVRHKGKKSASRKASDGRPSSE